MAIRIDTFFYGLFMDVELLRKKGVQPARVRQASVAGFALRIGDRATLIPDPAGCVHGVLMELSHAELDTLYAEPSVSAYRPEPVMAKLVDGRSVPALCFNLPAPLEQGQANPEYVTKLRAVARAVGLPESYVDSIR